MVIQCPSCGTRFSVEVEEFSGARNPTFHCSRCNHFFDLKGKRRSLTANRSEENTVSHNRDKDSKERQLSLLSEELLSEPAEWSTRTGMIDFNSEQRKNAEESELPLVTAEWPDSRTDREIEVDLSEVARRTTPFVKFPQFDTVEKRFEPEGRKPVITPPKFSEPAFVAKPAARSFESLQPRLGVAEREEPLRGELLKFPQSVSAPLSPVARAPKVNPLRDCSKGLGALGTAISAPLALAVLLWGASLTSLPSILLSSGNFAVAPPEGVELLSVTSAVRTLTDGRQAVEITGTVINSTPRTYGSPQIIVRSYNQENVKLAETVVPAVNGIQNTDNLQMLKAETLLRLQSEQGLIRNLKPGDRVPFRAALLIDGTSPSYFDAKVFSVKRSG
jgi:predicted Zn finger-like uncharacterized protein